MNDYVEVFDYSKLPNVDLSEEELGLIKKVVIREGMLNAIKKIIKYNTKIKIEFTDKEIEEIYNEIQLAKISKDKGSKDRIFLRTLVTKSLEKEVSKNNMIIKSALIFNKDIMKIPRTFMDNYFIQLYLTKDKIIKYEMTNTLEVVRKEIIPISQIKSAGIRKGRRSFWTIKLRYREIIWPVTSDYVSKEFGSFIKSLNEMGIKEM